jgi:hypothetical protein
LAYVDADNARDRADSLGYGGSKERANGLLTAPAHRSLDQIADALGVATALLYTSNDTGPVTAGRTVSMLEASALLQAYLQINDPEARQRCLTFVREAADGRSRL